MHNLILGKRNSAAQHRILATAGRLAEYFEIDPALVSSLKVQEKDAVIRAMKEREAVANLLHAIALNLGLEQPVEEVPAEAELEIIPEPEAEGTIVTMETGEGLPAPVIEGEADAGEEKPKRNPRKKKNQGKADA